MKIFLKVFEDKNVKEVDDFMKMVIQTWNRHYHMTEKTLLLQEWWSKWKTITPKFNFKLSHKWSWIFGRINSGHKYDQAVCSCHPTWTSTSRVAQSATIEIWCSHLKPLESMLKFSYPDNQPKWVVSYKLQAFKWPKVRWVPNIVPRYFCNGWYN